MPIPLHPVVITLIACLATSVNSLLCHLNRIKDTGFRYRDAAVSFLVCVSYGLLCFTILSLDLFIVFSRTYAVAKCNILACAKSVDLGRKKFSMMYVEEHCICHAPIYHLSVTLLYSWGHREESQGSKVIMPAEAVYL